MIKKILFLIIIYFLVIFPVSKLYAATLSVVPASASGSYSVGQVFSVPVLVSTVGGDPLNAVSGVISFPTNILQVLSIDKTGSMINFWISEPSYSNSEGTINFEGGSYNPGFSGSGGKVINILFKAKKTGSATLSFISSSVLANDGLGTNILDSANPTTITISAGATNPDEIPTSPDKALLVNSSTHPVQDKWYSSNKAIVSWKLSKGITAIRTKFDQNTSSLPSVLYSPPVLEKTLDITKDGVWYFHIQANDGDNWGSISHFKIQSDSTPPNDFTITFPDKISKDYSLLALFDTTDDMSGIDHYDVSISGSKPVSVSSSDISSDNPYTIPDQEPGQHTIQVIAYDKAGNSKTSSASFTVSGIEIPRLEGFKNSINEGDVLKFSGISHPGSTVFISLKDKNGVIEKQSVVSESDTGNFSLIWNKRLVKGVYYMTMQAFDQSGAKSPITKEIMITVKVPTINKISLSLISYTLLAAIILAILTGLVAWVLYLLHTLKIFKKKLSKKVERVDINITDNFKKVSKILYNQIRLLGNTSKKRALTKEEQQLVKVLWEVLDDLKVNIEKDIKGINF